MVFVYYLVRTLHVIACLFLMGVVLLQQGKGQDLASAFGGGGSQAAFGPRGSATVLSRATAILAGLFMVTSLSLSVPGTNRRSRQGTGAGGIATPGASTSPGAKATVPPASPGAPSAGRLRPAPSRVARHQVADGRGTTAGSRDHRYAGAAVLVVRG
jgi:preprotein translocase subunit SecG